MPIPLCSFSTATTVVFIFLPCVTPLHYLMNLFHQPALQSQIHPITLPIKGSMRQSISAGLPITNTTLALFSCLFFSSSPLFSSAPLLSLSPLIVPDQGPAQPHPCSITASQAHRNLDSLAQILSSWQPGVMPGAMNCTWSTSPLQNQAPCVVSGSPT